MGRSSRRIPPVLAPVLVALAIFGYVVGSQHGSSHKSAQPPGRQQIASDKNVVLEYPPTWKRGTHAITVPGLTITNSLTLIPRANREGAGLVSGELPAGGGPLPSDFMKRLSGLPSTEVINLLSEQVYRYSNIKLAGFGRSVILYVIPSATSGPTILVCYAESDTSPYLKQCEEIVATLSLVGEPSAELRPDNAYGTQLAVVLKRLDSDRRVLRQRMSLGEPPDQVAASATDLAGHFEQAKTSLDRIEPPAAASSTQALLVTAIDDARDAYDSLASAALDGNLVKYESARKEVEATESNVDLALESFALLGYGAAPASK
jgi:hypothetical protein